MTLASEMQRLDRAITEVCESVSRLRASHDRLLLAAKRIIRTFPLPLDKLIEAKEALEAAISDAEQL